MTKAHGTGHVFLSLVLLSSAFLVEKTAADSRFSFKLLQFSNPNGLLQSGDRCDYFSPCDTYFEICVGEKCRFGKQITPPVKQNSVDGAMLKPNKFDFTITAWPTDGPLKVQVTAWDDDANNDELITSFALLVHNRPGSFDKAMSFTGGLSRDTIGRFLRYETGARCNENYYGPSCQLYCIQPPCLSTTASPDSTTAFNVVNATTVSDNVTETSTTKSAADDPVTTTYPLELDQNQTSETDSILSVRPIIVKTATTMALKTDTDTDPASASASVSMIVVVLVAVVVLVFVSVLALMFMRRRKRKQRASRLPVIFDTDDSGSARTTVTSYCDTGDGEEIGRHMKPKSSCSIVRDSSAATRMSSINESDDAFQNDTYYFNSGNAKASACAVTEDTCGIYNRPPPPRPLHSDIDLLNNRRSIAQNVYSSPSEMHDEYYNYNQPK